MAKPALRIATLLSITLALLEIVLQLAFTALPAELIQRMPQYRERLGFRLETEHGAREYPAHESVQVTVNPQSGDLFRLTCLSTKYADSFTPYSVAYQRDRHGFRNPMPWRDDIDLVVVGDSFTAAESVQRPFWEELSPAMLSLGLPGSGALEQIQLLHAFAMPRKPETVVLAYFGGNDLADNQVFHELQRHGKTWARKPHENRSPFEYLVSVHLILLLRDTLLKSAAADCHYPLLAHTQPPQPVAFFDDMLPQLALDGVDLRATAMFQITRDAIEDLARELKAQGIRFVFVYIPQKAELYWRYLDASSQSRIARALSDEGHAVAADAITVKLSAQRELWHDIAAENGFDILDLTPILADEIAAGAAPYFFGDTHWNQIGHDIARDALRDSLN